MLEKLDPTPWLINPTPDLLDIYNHMKKFEKEWIEAIGYELNPSSKSRGIIVSQHRNLHIPHKLKQISETYLLEIQNEALKQKKKSTVGIRSGQDIFWSTLSGKKPINDYVWNNDEISRITVRKNDSWRGSFIKIGETLDYLYKKKTQTEKAMVNSAKAYQNARHQEQSNKYNEILNTISEIKKVALNYKESELRARIKSGQKITYRFYENNKGWSDTTGRYLVVYSTQQLELENSNTRNAKTRLLEISNVGEISIFLDQERKVSHDNRAYEEDAMCL